MSHTSLSDVHELTLGAVRARFRLDQAHSHERFHLERVFRSALDQPLERAMVEAGFAERELVCVDRLDVTMRLAPEQSDQRLATGWAGEVVNALAAALSSGKSRVMRYPSRISALTEMLVDLAAGRGERRWAWELLGICDRPAGGAGGAVVTARLPRHDRRSAGTGADHPLAPAIHALLDDPTSIIAVLRGALLRSGEVARALERLPLERWRELARAALLAARGPTRLLGEDRDPVQPSREAAITADDPRPDDPAHRAGGTWMADISRRRSARIVAEVDRIARRSVLVRELAGRPGVEAASRPIAILAIIDAEPGLLAAAPAQEAEAIVDRVAARVHGSRGRPDPLLVQTAPAVSSDAPAAAGPPPSTAGGDRDAAEDVRHRIADPPLVASAPVMSRDDPAASALSSSIAEGGREAATEIRRGPADGRQEPFPTRSATSSRDADTVVAPAASPAAPEADGAVDTWDAEPLDGRIVARTGSGGLLYLLHVAADLDIPTLAPRSRVLGHRGLRWILNEVAASLAACPPGDPAALAFAGLPPDADPPRTGEPPITLGEARALLGTRRRVIAGLRRRLADDETNAEELLSAVIDHPAVVLADPGWLEIRFPMEEVRTPIRAAGLDQNPGYLPWLGVVVRFSYV